MKNFLCGFFFWLAACAAPAPPAKVPTVTMPPAPSAAPVAQASPRGLSMMLKEGESLTDKSNAPVFALPFVDDIDPKLQAWGAAGHPIGWQPSWPINDCFESSKKVALGTGDCTLQTVIAELIANELSTHPAYLEFQGVQATASGVSASFAAAHKQIAGP